MLERQKIVITAGPASREASATAFTTEILLASLRSSFIDATYTIYSYCRALFCQDETFGLG